MHHPQGLGVFQPRVIRSRRQTSPYPDPVPISPHTTPSQAHEEWDLPSVSPADSYSHCPQHHGTESCHNLQTLAKKSQSKLLGDTHSIYSKNSQKTHRPRSGRVTTFVSLLGGGLDTCRLLALSPKASDIQEKGVEDSTCSPDHLPGPLKSVRLPTHPSVYIFI